MKNVIAYFILLFIFISCNIKNEGVVEAPVIVVSEDSLNKDTRTVSRADTLSSDSRLSKKTKLLLIARGSEPGWYAEFFEDHLRLLIDNGTDSLTMENDFSNIDQKNSYSLTFLKNALKGSLTLDIKIENKACAEEASGEKREKSITIKYNCKTYKGCATVNGD
jgi:uncharacterized membrane protein